MEQWLCALDNKFGEEFAYIWANHKTVEARCRDKGLEPTVLHEIGRSSIWLFNASYPAFSNIFVGCGRKGQSLQDGMHRARSGRILCQPHLVLIQTRRVLPTWRLIVSEYKGGRKSNKGKRNKGGKSKGKGKGKDGKGHEEKGKAATLRVSFPLCLGHVVNRTTRSHFAPSLDPNLRFHLKRKRRHGRLAVFRSVPRHLHSPCVRLDLPCHWVPAAPAPQGAAGAL